jgi:hypothetical protein
VDYAIIGDNKCVDKGRLHSLVAAYFVSSNMM